MTDHAASPRGANLPFARQSLPGAVVRVAVVEDDPNDQRQLLAQLDRFQREHSVRLDIRTYRDGRDLVRGYRSDWSLVLLDVQMEHMDGLETAHRIRALDSDVMLLFVTREARYATRGYEVDALNYLIKPVNYHALAREIDRALRRRRSTAGTAVLLPTTAGLARVPLTQVVYAASSKHRIEVHTADRTHAYSGTLKALEADLTREAGFFRSNSCYIVGLDHVREVTPVSCVMSDGAELAISRARRRPFLDALAERVARF